MDTRKGAVRGFSGLAILKSLRTAASSEVTSVLRGLLIIIRISCSVSEILGAKPRTVIH